MHFLILRFIKAYIPYVILGTLWSQNASVTGQVFNDNNKEPVQGADVYFKKISIGTTTESDGKFYIENLPFGVLSFSISIIGYEKINKTIAINQKTHNLGTFFLKRDTLAIKEIIVDAHGDTDPMSFASNIDFIGDDYHKNLKTTLAQLLEEKPGLSIQSMGQATGTPVLRGYKSDRFLLTEDGITVGDLSNTSIDHAISVDMASYSRIKIVRGPETLLFGSNTIGGVIDVSRETGSRPIFDKFSLQSLFGTESSNNGRYINIVSYLPINERNQFRFSMLKREADNQTSPIKTLENTALSNNEITGGYSFFGKANQLKLSFSKIKMDYGIPGSLEGHIDGVDIKMSKRSQRLNYHQDVSIFGFQRLDIDQRLILYSHSEYENGNDYATVSLGQDIFSIKSLLSNNHLKIGSLFQYRDYKAGGFYWTPDTKEIKTALFGLYEKKINKTILQLSSRIEHLIIRPERSFLFTSNLEEDEIANRNYTIFSTAIGTFRNWDYWRLSTSGMLASRAPSIDHLYSDGPHLGTYSYEIGQPNLKSENTFGLETSLEQNTAKSDFRLTLYHNYSPNYHVSVAQGNEYIPGADYIEWGSGSAGWLFKYQMKGLKTRIHGIESELSYDLTKLIKIYSSLSITRGENLSEKIPLSYMPPDRFLFSTELDLYPLTFDLIMKKVFDQDRLGEFETNTDGYVIVDLSSSYAINASSLIHKFIFTIDNIFNQEYYNHLSRIKDIMPEKGRSIGLQYRIVF